MKKPKLTPWFKADVKPVHVGVYQTRIAGRKDGFTWRWNGKKWGGTNGYICSSQNREWRGLASDPKASA